LEAALRKLLGAGAGLILAAIAGICFVEVVLRYGFGSSFAWYDEFVGYLLVWLTFVGAVLAQSHRQHIGIENLVENASGGTARALKLANHALMVAIHVVLLVYGTELVMRFLREDAITLPVPMGLVYVAIPASAALMLAIEAIHIARLLGRGATGAASSTR
jgi:TRAP-type C4-dicarboxylate transport system permease small subunit